MTGMSGGQGPPDGSDSEEAEKCPVCLGVLTGGELAMPDSCCHVFCLPCLLTWAEFQMSPSCPVDRRPFSNIYRWDGSLGLVQVPVQRRLTPTEAESCCCRNPERNVCLKSKLARRLRREKTERTADTKTRGLVRKCNDDDPSSLSRKKVRAIECCTWSPTPTIVTPTQDVSDPVWLTEDGPFDPELKHCKTQAQSCPWLSSAVPIPADGASRQRFYGSGWNNNSFPFGSISSPFASNSPFRPSHFVFQGVVCAVTCPKGGEKRGSRSSTPKAPNKQPESLPCRRSVRNSRSQEETTSANPKSPTKSSLSDSDSSAGQSTKLAKTSQVPTKRKGKRVANRKASGKRKATRKKSCSPAASEEEDEGDGADNNEMIEDPPREQEVNNSEQQNDAEGVLNEEQSVFTSAEQPVEAESLKSEEEGDESQDQYGEQQQKEKADGSCSSVSACDSPLSCSEDKREEEWPASPVKTEEKESEERTSHSSPDSHNILLENSVSPQSDEYTKQDDNIEICVPSQEANNEESSIDSKDELCNNLTFSGSPKSEMSEENLANQEERTFIETDVEMPESTECLRDESSKGAKDTTPKEDVTTPKEDVTTLKEDVTTLKEDLAMPKEDTVPKDGTPPRDDSMSKDDTNVVPMDCGSPISEHGNNLLFEPSDNKTYAASAIPPTPQTEVAKDDSTKRPQERERSQERKNGKPRRSRFHSPTSTWSPKRDSKKEPSRRSRSKERDGSVPVSRPSRARSRDRDRDGERDYSRRDRSHERRRRRPRSRSRSRSRSKSRSRSRSRTRSYRRMPSPERGLSRELSPQRKERRGGWKSGPGSGSGQDGRRYGGAGRFENGLLSENSLDRQGWSENPDWVTERTRVETEGRNRDLGSSGGSRWEDQRRSGGNGGEPRDRGGFERGRGAGGNCSFYNQQDEMADSRWQPRNNFSGTGNNSGNDSYSRFNENRGGGRKKESESGDSMLDRSGWSSASSWAVRRTLPADVQDYYSKRERGGVSSWNRQEEETQQPAATDPPKSDPPPPQVVPGNAPVAVMSVLPPHPPQLSVLHHQYPIQTLPVTLQPAAPYAMPPQVPVHLHPAVPLLQVPAVGTQGLPPPPPPPPPMQAGNQTSVTAAQPDGHTTQMMSTVVGFIKPTLLPTPTKASVAVVTQGQPAASQALPSSTTQHSKAQADSSKKEKKQQIQEKAINEVKTAIKPFYQKKEITKEEYKEIVRKAVEKVCHSKSGEVNSSKVANLVKAYVDKYKHARKK